MPRKKLLSLAATAAVAATAFAAPAQAAPDWTPARDMGDPAFLIAQVGYADGGLEIGVHSEPLNGQPVTGKLVVTRRRAGGDFETEATFDPSPRFVSFGYALDVAPNGAAVLAWEESDLENQVNGVHVFRAAYRAPDGTWEQPVLIASDPKLSGAAFPSMAASIGDDGTAVAGAAHLETGPDAEFQTDGRTDVRVHPAGSGWDVPKRLSTEERSGTELQLGVAADGKTTAAYVERTSEGSLKTGADDKSTVMTRRYSPSNGIWSSAETAGLTGTDSQATKLRLDVAPSGRAAIAFAAFGGGTRFTAATRRSSSDALFDPPDAVGVGTDNLPLAVGVAPDGASYVLLTDVAPNAAIVTRAASGAGSFSPGKTVGTAGQFSHGSIGFRGSDAFVGWDGFDNGDDLPQSTIWHAGSTAPDARRDLDSSSFIRSFIAMVPDRDGSVVAVWESSQATARQAIFDGSAPKAAEANVPSSGQAGDQLAMSARFVDLFSAVAEPEWDFGDGTSGRGGAVSHAYAAPGTYTVTVRGHDTFGNEARQTFPIAVTPAAAPQAPTPQPPAGTPGSPAAPADTIAPTVKLKLPAKKLRTTRKAWQTLKGTVADAQPSSGIKRIEVTAFRRGDKRKVRIAKLTGTAWKLKLPKLARGGYTFRVRVIDNAGNASKPLQQKAKLR